MQTIWAYLVQASSWSYHHWRAILTILAFIGGTMMGALKFWQFYSERHQKKMELQTKSIAQLIVIWVNAAKKKENAPNMIFSEDFLREQLGNGEEGLRLHAALEYLRERGQAGRSGFDHWWFK